MLVMPFKDEEEARKYARDYKYERRKRNGRGRGRRMSAEQLTARVEQRRNRLDRLDKIAMRDPLVAEGRDQTTGRWIGVA